MDDPGRILIIDDETEMQMFLSNLLKSENYQLMIARDSVEGLEKAGSREPDLIIMKDTIGKENGKLLYISLKQEPSLSSIPVVLLSSLDQQTIMHYLRILGGEVRTGAPEPDAVLSRPPEAEELLRVVHVLTNRV